MVAGNGADFTQRSAAERVLRTVKRGGDGSVQTPAASMCDPLEKKCLTKGDGFQKNRFFVGIFDEFSRSSCVGPLLIAPPPHPCRT